MSICPLQMPMWPSVCVILLAMTCGVESIWHDHHQRLVSHLFTNYSKHVRPSEDGLPTNVDIRMEPQKLVFLDEETEALHMKFVLMLRWTDARLRWDPEDFDNISKIFYQQSEIWVPIVSILNSLTKTNPLEFSDDTKIPISSEGVILWTIIENSYPTSCPIDTRFYPFDVQICTLHVTFYPMSTNDLNIRTDPDFAFYYGSIHSGTWELIDGRYSIKDQVDIRDTYNEIYYELVLRRRPLFYVINIILPVIFLSLTTTVVFLLPAEAGEKMGVSITVLLAYSVYLSIISDNLPQTSTYVCYLQVYLTSLLGITALGVMFSVLVLKVHHRLPDAPIGQKTRKLIKFASPILCINKEKNGMDMIPTDELDDSKKRRCFQNAVQDPARNIAQNTAQDAVQKAGQIVANNDTQTAAKNGAHNSARIASQNAIRNAAQRDVQSAPQYYDQSFVQSAPQNYVQSAAPHSASSPRDTTRTDPDDDLSWPQVAELLDRLIFTSFSCIIVLLTVATFSLIVTGSQDITMS